MSDAQGQPEPSMEEILASIRRIINEDGEDEDGGDGRQAPDAQAEQPAPAPEPEPPIAVDEPEPESEPQPRQQPEPVSPPAMPDEEEVLELSEDMIDAPQPAAPPAAGPGGLVSGATELAAAAAFGSLLNGRGAPPDMGAMPLGRGDTTLEQIVRELLRPLLKEWLDQNLPGMVDRIVREEVERIARSTRH